MSELSFETADLYVNGHEDQKMTTINATTFKAKCLKLMDNVHLLHSEIVVTKRGKPWVKIVPCGEAKPSPLLGCMAGAGKTVGDLTKPVAESWEVEQ